METKERKTKVGKVSFAKLFSFADSYDWLLMAVGSVGAIVHGASVPVFFIFFGKLIDLIGMAYLFPRETSHDVAKYSLDFVYLSVAILFSSWAEVGCWMYSGERQAAKMRMAYLKSMLNQDITLFDTEASTGEVVNAITTEILVVQDAISEKVGKVLHYVSRFLGGFIIGFVRVWQISLVTLSIVPFIACAGGIYAYVATGLIARVRKSYIQAGEIADEAIGNVRTVQAFVGEERAVNSYKTALIKTYEYGKKGGVARGLGLGTLHYVSSFCGCCSFGSPASSSTRTSPMEESHSPITTMLNVVIAGMCVLISPLFDVIFMLFV